MLEEKPFDAGYLHGNFNQTGTVTGRLSSSDPNQQNIPSRGELGRKMRSIFDAPEGYKIVCADYSQIELRMLANESKEEQMLQAFKEGIDPHQMTADEAKVTSSIGKTLNFAWAYGVGPRALADNIEKAGQPRPKEADARKWLNDLNQSYPTLVKWKEAVIRRARQLGYVPTVKNRKGIPSLQRSWRTRCVTRAC